MAKIIRKAKPAKTAKKKVVKAAKSKPAKKAAKPKPWTPAEVYEAFSRFRKANPEPKGELEHLNPYTLLVAVVLSAQATDAGVNKATRALFAVADTPQKMLDSARRGCAITSRPSAFTATRPGTSSRCRRS
jgi:endonuclease-3